MRKTNVTGKPLASQDSKAFIDTPNATDGLLKSRVAAESTISGFSKHLNKQLPQELEPQNNSTVILLARRKLVRSDKEPPGHAGATHPPKAVRPDLTAQVESFAKISGELPPLFLRHWEELALNRDTIPLDPDWDRYFRLEATGVLHITTARADGVLVGYIFNIVSKHLHYKTTVFAEVDMFWLDPAYRGTWFWLRWFKDNEAMLDTLGVSKVHVGIKNHYMAGRVGSIFRRLGYRPIETVWGR